MILLCTCTSLSFLCSKFFKQRMFICRGRTGSLFVLVINCIIRARHRGHVSRFANNLEWQSKWSKIRGKLHSIFFNVLQVWVLLRVSFLHPRPCRWQIILVATNDPVLLGTCTSNLVPILMIKIWSNFYRILIQMTISDTHSFHSCKFCYDFVSISLIHEKTLPLSRVIHFHCILRYQRIKERVVFFRDGTYEEN